MTLDDALRDLAADGNELPGAAMRWTLDHWDAAGPRLLTLLGAYERKQDRSEPAERALFFALHLLGEKREGAAFGPLCRLLLDGQASDLVLGDAITMTLPQLLISTFDGDLAALTAVIEATEADDFARYGALLAMAYLARTACLPEAEMRARLERWLAELRPQGEHFVWAGWMLAVAYLGYDDLAGAAEELITRGFVAPDCMGADEFRDELDRTLSDPDRMAGFAHENIGPFGEAIAELAGWQWSSEERAPEFADYEVQQPVTNPMRGVGRNDPCPCGSGKKFKKCCLV